MRPHTALALVLLDSFGWDVLNHPSNSPDLVPSDYNLFTSLMAHMGGIKFSINEQVQKEVLKWGKGLAGEFFEGGIKKIVPRLTTCIEWDGDYVEKQSTSVSTISRSFFSNTFFLKI
ncbi:hypothetical protein J437_LFUL011188 [Ladona fulva]|uniref:Transposase n=1 Tax=Ladona fulva TaxID=123851 RepID=A0A8K0P5X6_LADFU|nr:hypothetical protein J437_LFUL011188 [Ladona fulva]